MIATLVPVRIVETVRESSMVSVMRASVLMSTTEVRASTFGDHL